MECPSCKMAYEVRDSIPILLPQAKLSAQIKNKTIELNQVRAIYDRAYALDDLMGTDLDAEYDRATKTHLLNSAAPLEGKTVLDLGTGVGNLWKYAPDSAKGHALDLSYSGVLRASRRYPNLVVSVSVAEHLPYPPAFFDVVIAADTLEHAFDPARAISEIKRVLKLSGVLAASLPVPNSLRKWGQNQLTSGRWKSRLPLHLARVMLKRMWLFGRADFQPIDRDLNVEQWIELLRNVGFDVQGEVKWPAPPSLPIVYLLSATKSHQ